jgi:hypothetical protein
MPIACIGREGEPVFQPPWEWLSRVPNSGSGSMGALGLAQQGAAARGSVGARGRACKAP